MTIVLQGVCMNLNTFVIYGRKFFNSHLFWLNSHPFFTRPIICRLNLSVPTPPPLCSFDLGIYII